MFTDLIKKRRSVRTYSDKPIARETLQVIVDAVFHAPTAKNLNDVEPVSYTHLDVYKRQA